MNSQPQHRDTQFFEKILRFSHPLCLGVVRSVVGTSPGIYLIRKGTDVVYVGRSTSNLQQRLAIHCNNRDYYGHHFSFYHVKTALESFRVESQAIFYFNRIQKLTNRINAALPAGLKNRR